MSNVDPTRLTWRKSSYSGNNNNGDCVEVAFPTSAAAVRDSKNPDRDILTVPQTSWVRFVRSL